MYEIIIKSTRIKIMQGVGNWYGHSEKKEELKELIDSAIEDAIKKAIESRE